MKENRKVLLMMLSWWRLVMFDSTIAHIMLDE
jgi:hypothetical protein